MSKRTPKDSITMDSNPEGINQYTGGGGRGAEGALKNAQAEAKEATAKAHASGSPKDHAAAAKAHSAAAVAAGKTEFGSATKYMHEKVAEYHSARAKEKQVNEAKLSPSARAERSTEKLLAMSRSGSNPSAAEWKAGAQLHREAAKHHAEKGNALRAHQHKEDEKHHNRKAKEAAR